MISYYLYTTYLSAETKKGIRSYIFTQSLVNAFMALSRKYLELLDCFTPNADNALYWTFLKSYIVW